MKVKKIKIGIESVKDVLDDFVKAGEAIERGEEGKMDVKNQCQWFIIIE